MPRAFWLYLLLLVVVILVVSVIYRTRHLKRETDVVKVRQEIHDALPVGSSRAQVEAYLERRGVPHSYTDESQNPEARHTEAAIIRGASKSWLVRGDIQILLKFDDHDRLTTSTVREIFTGP